MDNYYTVYKQKEEDPFDVAQFIKTYINNTSNQRKELDLTNEDFLQKLIALRQGLFNKDKTENPDQK